MKILQVNVVADRGSTGKICQCIDEAVVAAGHESLVCYGRKSTASRLRRYKFGREWEAAASKVANRVGALMYASSLLSTRRLIGKICEWRPDVVHLHCINGYCVDIYCLLRYLAKASIPTVVTHHAEFFYTGNCGHALDCTKFAGDEGCKNCPQHKGATGSMTVDRAHTAWQRMRQAFKAFGPGKLTFTAVSAWVRERSQMSPITSQYDCTVVENGLDTSVFRLVTDRRAARLLVPNVGRRLVLHVTASFSDSPAAFKGGAYVVEMARRMPDVTFAVVASYSSVTGKLPPNLHLIGRAKNQQELAALYNAADATLITSRRETFSMVVAESLCCGTPVVGFKAGGPESIALPEYSCFVDYGDTNALQDALASILDRGAHPQAIAAEAQRRYSARRMAENYINVYKHLLENQ